MNHFCEGYKTFFREALPELKRMAEYFRRGQTPPFKAPAGAPAPAAPQPERPQPQVAQPNLVAADSHALRPGANCSRK